jgi:nucleoside-diphosphate-sugar epimerase
MKVFLAGATGAIGRPLTTALIDAGHQVTAMTRSEQSAAGLRERGMQAVVADAFDESAVRTAIAAAKPEVLIHQLTALPTSGGARAFSKGLALTARLRRETVPVMLDAAAQVGARRAIVQSISFVTAPDGRPVHDENAPIWTDSPDEETALTIQAVAAMESSVANSPLDGIVLRYGFFYGPGTAWASDGQFGKLLRRRLYPILGDGSGRMSFVHIDDAVTATVLALDRGSSGVYNIGEPDPQPVSVTLPQAAAAVGAKPPRRIPGPIARRIAPYGLLHYSTTLPGNSSARATAELGWSPRHTWPT